MPEQITGWKTKKGKVFEKQSQASFAEAKEMFEDIYPLNSMRDANDSEVEFEELFNWIENNSGGLEEVAKKLNNAKHQKACENQKPEEVDHG